MKKWLSIFSEKINRLIVTGGDVNSWIYSIVSEQLIIEGCVSYNEPILAVQAFPKSKPMWKSNKKPSKSRKRGSENKRAIRSSAAEQMGEAS